MITITLWETRGTTGLPPETEGSRDAVLPSHRASSPGGRCLWKHVAHVGGSMWHTCREPRTSRARRPVSHVRGKHMSRVGGNILYVRGSTVTCERNTHVA